MKFVMMMTVVMIGNFCELKNVGCRTIDLSELYIGLINNGVAGTTESLSSNFLSPRDFWVIGSGSSAALEVTPNESVSFNFLNGPSDGLLIGRVSDGVIIDSVVYEGSTHPAGATDSGNAGEASGDSLSLSRISDGTDNNDNSADFVLATPTIGVSNGQFDLFLLKVENWNLLD